MCTILRIFLYFNEIRIAIPAPVEAAEAAEEPAVVAE